MKKWKIFRSVTAWVTMTCLLSVQTGMRSMADEAVASVMRLAATEGTVAIESQNGKTIEMREDMKLYSGNVLKTAKASYAYVSLDDTKAVKLDALSKAQIRKSGKKQEMLLESGNLFFNVTAPLKEDESLNIRTSTMVTGIRGTAGYVEAVSDKETVVSLLDGKVTCRGYDSGDGQVKDFTIIAGQKASFLAREDDDMADIVVKEISEADVPGFVAMEIKKGAALQSEITASTGLDISLIVNQADEKLKQKESETGAALDQISNAIGKAGNIINTDSVFSQNSGASGSGTSGSRNPGSGANNKPPLPVPTVSREMPVTVEELNILLKTNNVILATGSGVSPLILSGSLSIPQERKLSIGAGIPVTVNPGVTLRVDGSMEVQEDVTNNGTIVNTSSNTLRVKGGLANAATGVIDNTGRLLVSGTLVNNGLLDNRNQIETSGAISHLDGQIRNTGSMNSVINSAAAFDMSAGTLKQISQTSGTLALSGGTVEHGIEIGTAAEFIMSGGEVRPGSSGSAVESRGQLILSGGMIYGKGASVALNVFEGSLNLSGTEISADSPDYFFATGSSVQFFYNDAPASLSGRFNRLRVGSSYVMGGYFMTLSEALQGAVAGETVTVLAGDGILEAAAAGQFVMNAGQEDNPVVFDLNGCNVELKSTIVVGTDGSPGTLTVTNSGRVGSLFMGTGSSVPMFILGDGGALNLLNADLTYAGNNVMISGGSGDSLLNITGCSLISSSDQEILTFPGNSAGHAEISDSELISSVPGEAPAISLGEMAELKLVNSKMIQTDRTAVLIDGGTFVISGEVSSIENTSASHPAILRTSSADIQLEGGTICNKSGNGFVFGDDGIEVLPKADEMKTDIKKNAAGKTDPETDKGLFGRRTDATYTGYTPEGYTVILKDGYFHITPEEEKLAVALTEEVSDTPEPATPSDAEYREPDILPEQDESQPEETTDALKPAPPVEDGKQEEVNPPETEAPPKTEVLPETEAGQPGELPDETDSSLYPDTGPEEPEILPDADDDISDEKQESDTEKPDMEEETKHPSDPFLRPEPQEAVTEREEEVL